MKTGKKEKDLKTQTTPLRLQAYERLTLFLERITLSKLLIRVHPISDKSNDYETLLVATIEQEFEHNLAQQIYVSDDCWKVLVSCKNNTIQSIRKSYVFHSLSKYQVQKYPEVGT